MGGELNHCLQALGELSYIPTGFSQPLSCTVEEANVRLVWKILTTHQAYKDPHLGDRIHYVGPMQPNGCVRVLLIFPLNCSLSLLNYPRTQ